MKLVVSFLLMALAVCSSAHAEITCGDASRRQIVLHDDLTVTLSGLEVAGLPSDIRYFCVPRSRAKPGWFQENSMGCYRRDNNLLGFVIQATKVYGLITVQLKAADQRTVVYTGICAD